MTFVECQLLIAVAFCSFNAFRHLNNEKIMSANRLLSPHCNLELTHQLKIISSPFQKIVKHPPKFKISTPFE